MIIAERYLAQCSTTMEAYMRLQAALMEHFFALGGTPEEWSERLAPAFAERYGWIRSAYAERRNVQAAPPEDGMGDPPRRAR